jgi:hypothetical protein
MVHGGSRKDKLLLTKRRIPEMNKCNDVIYLVIENGKSGFVQYSDDFFEIHV